MIGKVYLLLISGVISLAILILNWIGTFTLCGGKEYGQCMDNTYSLLLILFPVIPVFFVALIIYFTHEEIYRSWFKFARWWIPLSMFLVLITPQYGGGLFNPIQKGSVAVATSALFVFISLVIITVKYLRTRV